MKIDLSDDLRVVGTPHAWELQKRRVVRGKDRWNAYRWYRTFGLAVQGAVHGEIREHPAQSLVEAIEGVNTLVHRYARLIPCEYEIRLKEPKL